MARGRAPAGSEELVAVLIEVLREMAELLGGDTTGHGPGMARLADQLAAGDRSAGTRLLGCYGGMGSIDDVVLGRPPFSAADRARNDRYAELTTQAWDLATSLSSGGREAR